MTNNRQTWLNRIATVKAEGRIPIVAEIKPSSPAAGDLLRNRHLTDITRAYEKGGAACISVVTGRWFGGKLSMLSEVAKVTSLPLLRKDLITNQEQIKVSQDHGANAVLLTKQLLTTRHLRKMIELCHSLHITPFIEVANSEELSALDSDPKAIVGITNRNIAQQETDVHSGLNSQHLLCEVRQSFGAVVSASGIHHRQEASLLFAQGFDGMLVGTSLLQADCPQNAVKKLSTVSQLLTPAEQLEVDEYDYSG